MDSLDRRAASQPHVQLVLVAVLVCFFASSMAGMLNFFKYRSNAEHLVLDRLVVTGQGIEASIRSSLSLGMQFREIGTLQDKLERELRTDELSRTIEVFDNDGETLYSTDKLHKLRGVPSTWVAAVKDAEGDPYWIVRDGVNSAVGVPVRNTIGLVIGQLAVSYDEAMVNKPIYAVGRQIAIMSLLSFIGSALLASLALLALLRGISRDLAGVEAYIQAHDKAGADGEGPIQGPFGAALGRFFGTVRRADKHITALRDALRRETAS